MKIIDAHSHYMPPEVAQHTAFFKVGWSDANKHLSMMDEVGIESSLLLYPTSDAHIGMQGWKNLSRVYNQAIADVVRKFPGRFYGAGIIPVDSPQDFIFELERMRDLGLHAISLASSYEGKYLDDEMFVPVFEFARKNKFPVHVHAQIMNPIGEDRVRDPLLSPVLEYVFDVSMCLGKMMMSGTFSKFPDVKFIFAHYGGALPLLKERFDNTYVMLRRREIVKDLGKSPSEFFKNLYFDTSGSRSIASLRCALEIVNLENIIFGSDFPANQNMKNSVLFLNESNFLDEDIQSILQNNFLKIFKNS